MTEITIHYERKFSDGNYGSEGLSLSETFTVADGQLSPDFEPIALHMRELVLGFLVAHGSPNVAYAARRELNPPTPAIAPLAELEEIPF